MQEHWVGKHSLTLYSFPELNPHRLLVIVAMHLDKDTRTHACTRAHTQTWSNLNNELLAVMGKHCEQSYTQQHIFNLYLCMCEKKRKSEREQAQHLCLELQICISLCADTPWRLFTSQVSRSFQHPATPEGTVTGTNKAAENAKINYFQLSQPATLSMCPQATQSLS